MRDELDQRIIRKVADWLSRPPRASGRLDLPEMGLCLNTSLGLVREENQDRIIAVRFRTSSEEKSFFLLGLADGMGGLKDGAGCASRALAALVTSLLTDRESPEPERLRNALRDANTAVYDVYQERGGTTLVGVLITKEAVTAASVGDSRLYSFSRSSLEQISEDDSIGAELERIRPDLNRSLDIGGFGRHLTQYVGMGKGFEPHIYQKIPDGQSILLATDGIDCIPRPVLVDLISTAKGSSELSTRLVQVANWTGGKDNSSVLILSTPSAQRNGNLISKSEDSTLEFWDCFGKYEMQLEALPTIPRSLARQDTQFRPPAEEPQGPAEKPNTKRKRLKPRPRGEVQISLVDDNGNEVVLKSGEEGKEKPAVPSANPKAGLVADSNQEIPTESSQIQGSKAPQSKDHGDPETEEHAKSA